MRTDKRYWIYIPPAMARNLLFDRETLCIINVMSHKYKHLHSNKLIIACH